MKLKTLALTTLILVTIQTKSLAVLNRPLKSIPVELLFETSVGGPHHLSLCAGSLWTFSESDQKLVSFNSKNGKIRNAISIPQISNTKKPIDVAALACQQGLLYVLINDLPEGFILELKAEGEKLVVTNRYVLPEKSRASDLFCSMNQCWLLQTSPQTTNDFKKWMPIRVPALRDLKKINSHSDLDPFEDWQATLSLAAGRYSLGAVDSNNQYVFLDPFAAQAVISAGTEWVKWGSFGAWEGSFLSPKAMTFVTENSLVVADSKLKAIFLFRRDGTYLGVLAWGPSLIFSPDYPLGMASEEHHLFLADFRANKIVAVGIKEYKSKFEETAPLTVRQNLFRREEVLKDHPSSLCLNCHDGTVSNQLYKFTQLGFHHPLECSQCHDPHHELKNKFYLRQEPKDLCLSCHKPYADPKTNHVWTGPSRKGGSCVDCHQSHADSDKLLIAKTPQLCLTCHRDKEFTHKSVDDLSTLSKSKSVQVKGGLITCQTCHQTHINWRDTHFVKPNELVLPLCSSCHGEKSPGLIKEFHKKLKSAKGHK